jgi:hypothetical protein
VRDWVSVFDTWAKPLSDTEAEKAARAERLVREAIEASSVLAPRTIRVFAQGSYRNDTNVRLESDVDISVCCTDTMIPDYSQIPGVTPESLGNRPSAYTERQFKAEVGEALVERFGARGVARGNKVFTVHENTVRLDADVAPTFELRVYYRADGNAITYLKGTSLRTDGEHRIWNFPDQHFECGLTRNVATNLGFKRLVRIVKRLRNEMDERGVPAAGPAASFLLESLVYNATNAAFAHSTYYEDVRAILIELYAQLQPGAAGERWLEVNQRKALFGPFQQWTIQQARDFVVAAWQYVGF